MKNQGSGSSDATTLRYYRSTDATITTSDTELGTAAVGGLTPSGTISTPVIDITTPSEAGTYYYGACVDAVPGESDTTNNCSGSISIHRGVMTGDMVMRQRSLMSNYLPARWIPRCSEGKPDGMPRQTNHLVRDVSRGNDVAVRSALRAAFGQTACRTGAVGGAGRLMQQPGTYQTRIFDYGGVDRSVGDATLAACAALYGQVPAEVVC